ncbi:MAG: TetR/AcrR family transcriptional regulator [Actinomycetia bacterium]|nr:TetR/AcrR family transcriptional regulator [Actinomycetes bacterium]
MASVRTEEARERLLAAADELFYAEGVHTVGIDRVIQHAGVAKATLYSAFGSKDALIRAYLTRRYEGWHARITEKIAGYETPRDRLLGVFDWLDEAFAHPDFHGCAFMNATAEDRPDGPSQDPAAVYRAAVRSMFRDLADAAGAVDPGHLALQLGLLYDGAMVAAQMDHDRGAGATAREVAAALLDAATGVGGVGPSTGSPTPVRTSSSRHAPSSA